MRKIYLLVFVFSIIVASCSSKGGSSSSHSSSYYDSDDEEEYYEDDYGYSNYGSNFEDGTYTAEVGYFNPETGYYATYTLDVDVEDGMVVTIYFPNGGWLDDDHIDPAELDDDGNCTVYGEDGKEYEVHVYR